MLADYTSPGPMGWTNSFAKTQPLTTVTTSSRRERQGHLPRVSRPGEIHGNAASKPSRAEDRGKDRVQYVELELQRALPSFQNNLSSQSARKAFTATPSDSNGWLLHTACDIQNNAAMLTLIQMHPDILVDKTPGEWLDAPRRGRARRARSAP